MSQTSPMGELLIWYGIPAGVLLLVFLVAWYLTRRNNQETVKEPPRSSFTNRPAVDTPKKPAEEVQKDRLAGRRPVRSVPPFAYLEPLDKDRGDRRTIDRFPYCVGRSRSNDLVIKHHSVSRQHAELISSSDGYIQLIDLESLNGVFVNEHKVEELILNEGDVIEFGDIRYRFTQIEEEDDHDATTQVALTD